MSELHKFLFDGLPVRGAMVRLTDAWAEVQQRRAGNSVSGAYCPPVAELLGEMLAAAVLMQSHITFNGALVLQIQGDGPLKLAVAEVRSDLGLRATASIQGEVAANARLPEMVNCNGAGRCAITLDPHDRNPGQRPYQGIVPLQAHEGVPFDNLAQALQFYMAQSEQLDTVLVLAANAHVAAGLLLQRMPLQGQANLGSTARTAHDAAGAGVQDADDANERAQEDYNRIAHLAASLTRQELLTLDVDTLLHRLFWNEQLLRFVPEHGKNGPHFSCTCSRERVATMLRNLGALEVQSIVAERGHIEVGCEFCGQQYHFDAVDAAQLLTAPGQQPPAPSAVQ